MHHDSARLLAADGACCCTCVTNQSIHTGALLTLLHVRRTSSTFA